MGNGRTKLLLLLALPLLALAAVAGWLLMDGPGRVSPGAASLPNVCGEANTKPLEVGANQRRPINQDGGDQSVGTSNAGPGRNVPGGTEEGPPFIQDNGGSNGNRSATSEPFLAAVPFARSTPPPLAWGSEAHLPFDSSDAEPVEAGEYPDHSVYPENTAVIFLGLHDATSKEHIFEGYAEITDAQGRLRARGALGRRRRYFQLSYEKDTTLFIMAQAGDRIGYATVGTGSGSPAVPSGALHRAEGRRMLFMLDIEVSTAVERQTGGVRLRVVDGSGSPLPQATIYRNYHVLGQTDEQGRVTVLVNSWSEPKAVTIHSPGFVPVFVQTEQLAATAGTETETEVVLRAKECVLEFRLPVPAEYRVGEPLDIAAIALENDRGVFADDEDPLEELNNKWWRPEHLGYSSTKKNHKLIEAATGVKYSDALGQLYNRWYARQWRYDPATGGWQVVVPHAGRFVIAVRVEARDITTYGPTRNVAAMYPGLLIDATDPANPRAELIYPP